MKIKYISNHHPGYVIVPWEGNFHPFPSGFPFNGACHVALGHSIAAVCFHLVSKVLSRDVHKGGNMEDFRWKDYPKYYMGLFLWPTIWGSLGSINVGKKIYYIHWPYGYIGQATLIYGNLPTWVIPSDHPVLQKLRLVSTLGEERLGGFGETLLPCTEREKDNHRLKVPLEWDMLAPSSVFSKLHLSLMASEPGGWSNGWKLSEARHIPDFMVMKSIKIQESKRNITLKWIHPSNVIGQTQFAKSHQKVTTWHDEHFYQQVKWITLHRPNEIYLHTFWKAGNHDELSYISDFSGTISWRKHPKEANQEFLFAKVVRKCWTNELSSTMYNDYINMTKCEKVYTNTLCAHFVSSIEYNTPS